MDYKSAWNSMISIVENVRENKIDDDLDVIIMCVDYLQSGINSDSISSSQTTA